MNFFLVFLGFFFIFNNILKDPSYTTVNVHNNKHTNRTGNVIYIANLNGSITCCFKTHEQQIDITIHDEDPVHITSWLISGNGNITLNLYNNYIKIKNNRFNIVEAKCN